MIGGQLRRLTSLRWFAALAVFVCHVGEQRHGPSALTPIGGIGVSFFFALSGFVLVWSVRRNEPARMFWRRRFARIYPATMTAMVVSVALWLLAVPHMRMTSPWAFVAGVFLIQSWWPSKNVSEVGPGVTWSLACEAFFYLLLPLILPAVRRRPRVALAVAVGALLAVGLVSVAASTGYTYYCPLTRFPEFLLGVVLAVLVQQGWVPRIRWAPALGLLGFGTILSLSLYAPAQVLVYAAFPGVTAVLLAAVSSDLNDRPGWLTSRALVYFGEVSFCFYLVHAMVIRVVVVDGRTFGGDGSASRLAVLAVVALAVSFAAATALHHGVELPMQRRILRKRQVKPAVCCPDGIVSVSPEAVVTLEANPAH